MNIFKPRSNTDSIPFCVSEAVSTVPVMLAAMSSSFLAHSQMGLWAEENRAFWANISRRSVSRFPMFTASSGLSYSLQ